MFKRALAGAIFTCISSFAQSGYYQSAVVDADGQLHILLGSGKRIDAPKLPDQKAFDSPLVSADHSTVGWLAEWPDPNYNYFSPLDGELVIYRKGRMLRKFSTEQVFWKWKFTERDSAVIYCTGATHGGITFCEMRRLTSGKLLEQWGYDEHHAKYPSWMPADWIDDLRQPAD